MSNLESSGAVEGALSHDTDVVPYYGNDSTTVYEQHVEPESPYDPVTAEKLPEVWGAQGNDTAALERLWNSELEQHGVIDGELVENNEIVPVKSAAEPDIVDGEVVENMPVPVGQTGARAADANSGNRTSESWGESSSTALGASHNATTTERTAAGQTVTNSETVNRTVQGSRYTTQAETTTYTETQITETAQTMQRQAEYASAASDIRTAFSHVDQARNPESSEALLSAAQALIASVQYRVKRGGKLNDGQAAAVYASAMIAGGEVIATEDMRENGRVSKGAARKVYEFVVDGITEAVSCMAAGPEREAMAAEGIGYAISAREYSRGATQTRIRAGAADGASQEAAYGLSAEDGDGNSKPTKIVGESTETTAGSQTMTNEVTNVSLSQVAETFNQTISETVQTTSEIPGGTVAAGVTEQVDAPVGATTSDTAAVTESQADTTIEPIPDTIRDDDEQTATNEQTYEEVEADAWPVDDGEQFALPSGLFAQDGETGGLFQQLTNMMQHEITTGEESDDLNLFSQLFMDALNTEPERVLA
jgi:hypothetical protein